jgi:uncharacterized protein YerC
MGFFKDIHIQIQEWLALGRSVEETYIYFKDYVTMEQVQAIANQEYDSDPVDC